MNRIENYKHSLHKYSISKSCLKQPNLMPFLKYLTNTSKLLPIIVLTIITNLNKKNKNYILGYDLACGIDLYEASIRTNAINIQPIGTKCIINNISNILTSHNASFNPLKIINYINNKLILLNNSEPSYAYKYIQLSQLAFVAANMFGMGDKKYFNHFELMGNHMGIMLQILDDFDIKQNVGIVSTFFEQNGEHTMYEQFMDNKKHIIKIALELNMLSATFQEILDSMQTKIDGILEALSIDTKL